MNKRALKLLIIPLVITAIYFALQSFLLFNHFGISSVVEEISLDFEKTNQQDVHLLKGQKASATFKATDDNLGILLIQLVKFGQGSDRVIFRIKKVGEKKWYHESKFQGDQVQNNQYFPLGFPPIINSKNNIYVFEIESQAGEYNNGVGVTKDKQTAVMYKYSSGDLANYKKLLPFISKKSLYILKNINYWQLAAIFFASYLLTFSLRNKKLTVSGTVIFLLNLKKNSRAALRLIIKEIKSKYLLQKRKTIYFIQQLNYRFVSTKLYSYILNSGTKKKFVIWMLIFLLALTYRFSTSLVSLESLFYYALGGQGDYDQFIRAATCAVRNFAH